MTDAMPHTPPSPPTQPHADVLGIYYHHFGIENLAQRRRRYAADQLRQQLDPILHTWRWTTGCRSVREALLQIKRIAEILDGVTSHPVSVMTSGKLFDICYRNHIYPAEIQTPGSAFYGADVRKIDAILIDRDPSRSAHLEIRGKWRHRTSLDTDHGGM